MKPSQFSESVGKYTKQIQTKFTLLLLFHIIEVIARSMQAFSSTAGSRIGGAIPPAMMKKDSADRKEIELIHVPWDFSDVQNLAGPRVRNHRSQQK